MTQAICEGLSKSGNTEYLDPEAVWEGCLFTKRPWQEFDECHRRVNGVKCAAFVVNESVAGSCLEGRPNPAATLATEALACRSNCHTAITPKTGQLSDEVVE